MKTNFVPLASILLLTACGGSGSGSGINTGNADADALVSTAENVFDTFETIADAEGETPFTAVTAETGTASYSGVAILVAGTDDGMTETIDYAAIGSFTVTADFGVAQDVTGTADGFFELSNPEIANEDTAELSDIQVAGPVEGSFSFDLSIDNLSGFAIADGSVNGSLTQLDSNVIAINDPDATGDFYGDDLDVLEVSAGEFDDTSFVELNATGLR